ncbi:MAG: hypothetical protein Q8P46_05005 [Hyphomicrobiales bacterium]|nr:hypothetical protein [Hyphomicrobiales bacterium]
MVKEALRGFWKKGSATMDRRGFLRLFPAAGALAAGTALGGLPEVRASGIETAGPTKVGKLGRNISHSKYQRLVDPEKWAACKRDLVWGLHDGVLREMPCWIGVERDNETGMRATVWLYELPDNILVVDSISSIDANAPFLSDPDFSDEIKKWTNDLSLIPYGHGEKTDNIFEDIGSTEYLNLEAVMVDDVKYYSSSSYAKKLPIVLAKLSTSSWQMDDLLQRIDNQTIWHVGDSLFDWYVENAYAAMRDNGKWEAPFPYRGEKRGDFKCKITGFYALCLANAARLDSKGLLS